MATPGWYPDPAGRPGHFRFWDGDRWGDDTSDDPYAEGQAPRSAPDPDAAPSTPQPVAPPPPPGPPGLPGPALDVPAPRPLLTFVLLTALVTVLVGVVTYLVVRPLV